MPPEQSEIKQTPPKNVFDDEEVRERVRNLYSDVRENRHVLLELFQKGQQDELDEAIDSLSDDLMLGDATYQDLHRQLKDNEKNSQKIKSANEQVIVQQIRQLQDNYRQIIVLYLNLPDKVRLNQSNRAASDVKDFLHENDFDGQSPQEALRILGIATPQEDGKVIYQFPSEFMPKDVNIKWETYLSTVIAHVKAVDNLANGTGSQKEVTTADEVRKYAHDRVTTDVHRILGLDGIQGWNFQSTRGTLADIRDTLLPTEAATRSADANKLLADHHGYVAATQLLTSRYHS